MRRARALLLLLPLAVRADAGQVLTFSEDGTRDGRPYRSSLTLRVSPEGVRAEATDLSTPGAKPVVYLYVAKDDRILPIDPPTAPVISKATIAAVEERARAAGKKRRPGAFTATPLHSAQSFGRFTCEAWAVRRPGRTTEIVCLADPEAAGIDAATRAPLARMNALFVPFVNAASLAEGDAREAFDPYTLEAGFPVRTFRSKDGVVELDARLVSVENADLPADLFRAPAAGPPATPGPPASTRAAAADRSIPLERWATRGMPDPGRAWAGADYEAAATLLEAAAKEDATLLPRETSPDSGALFRRLVNPENLAPAQGSGPADARAKAGAGVLAGADRLTLLWAAAYRDDAARGGELAALMAFTLRAARDVVPLADAAVAASPKKNPLRAARVESLRRTHAALASIVNACLAGLATAGGFRPAERLRLARAFEENVPSLASYLPPADRNALPARLKRMSSAEADPAVKDALDRTRAALARTASAKPTPKAA